MMSLLQRVFLIGGAKKSLPPIISDTFERMDRLVNAQSIRVSNTEDPERNIAESETLRILEERVGLIKDSLPHLRLATTQEYGDFLMKYLEAGGVLQDKGGSRVDDPNYQTQIFFADQNVIIPKGFARQAYLILAPENIEVSRVHLHGTYTNTDDTIINEEEITYNYDHGVTYRQNGVVEGSHPAPYFFDDAVDHMISRGWIFKPEHFHPNCRYKDELIARTNTKATLTP